MSGMTSDRLEELRRIAEAATPGPWWVDGWEARTKDDDRFIASIAPAFQGASPDASCWEVDANIQHIAAFDPTTCLVLLDEIERLRRDRDAALDVLGREDIGDGAKVEGVRLILKGGGRGWPTRESERARLVGEVGECCRGADPLCAAGCLVEAALRQRLVDKEGTA